MRIKKIFILIFFTFIVGSTFQNKVITIFLAGDSTIAEKLIEKRPETGWGEKIGIFFSENIKSKMLYETQCHVNSHELTVKKH